MSPSLLEQIKSPTDLKALSDDELAVIAAEIRLRLIQVTSQNGGHLASSLGATDIIVAMHAVYNAPTDQLVFDTGHQAYAHKLLTGRQADFSSLRQFKGLSGFIRRNESPYDTHDSGHASDALSIAMGLVLARDLSGGDQRVVTLVGDAAVSGGMAFEALNQIGHEGRDITIILNDNEMSIAHNVGALSLYLAKVRSSRPYIRTRDTIEERLSRLGNPGRYLVDMGERMRDSAKLFLIGGTLFEDMGITYLGPVDGHSIEHLRMVMLASQQIKGPVLIHAFTQKGKGYLPAEADPELFHGASRFVVSTGHFVENTTGKSYTEYFSEALMAEAALDQRIVAITAAMPKGTGLDCFEQRFHDRFFDVGIAEEHAVTVAAGMALGGSLPVVAIYSSFLQRAYDQLLTNVCLMNQHIVFCLDRAGLVGEDGTTHHGLFDLAYLRTMPNMQILAPASATQLVDALHTALHLDGPVAIRFPRGEAFTLPGEKNAAAEVAAGEVAAGDIAVAEVAVAEVAAAGEQNAAAEVAVAGEQNAVGEVAAREVATPEVAAAGEMLPKTVAPEMAVSEARFLQPGRAELVLAGSDVAMLALGSMVKPALKAAQVLSTKGISAAVYNMLWVKPLDLELLANLSSFGLLVTLEEGTLNGGFSSAVLEALADLSLAKPNGSRSFPPVLRIGIPDKFVAHGSIAELSQDLGLDASSIVDRITDAWRADQV